MARRTRANNGDGTTPENDPVRVRSMNRPKNGWTEAEARDLLRQGYADEQVARVTGYALEWVKAQKVPWKAIHPALADVHPQDRSLAGDR